MRELFQNNFTLKIFSLILATLLWFAIESSLHRKSRLATNPFTEEFTLPHTVAVMVPTGTDKTYDVDPAEVELKLAGSPELLGELGANDVDVFVKLPANLQTETILPVDVKLPPAIRLIRTQPAEVSVKPRKAIKKPEPLITPTE